MNWKLILELSLIGVAMGIATVFWIPSSVEPFLWLLILVFSAIVIAKRCGSRPFVHGLLSSVALFLWIAGAYVLLFNQYLATHPSEAVLMQSVSRPELAPEMVAVLVPAVGGIFGVVLGFCSLIAFKLMGREQAV